MPGLKVALVGPTHPFRGGIAHHTHLLATHAGGLHDVRLYGYDRLYPSWLFPGRSQWDPSPPPVPPVVSRRWLVPWLPTTWQRVSREFQRWRPQVAIVQWWVPFLAPVTGRLVRSARRAGARTIAVCHNVLPHESHPFDRMLARAALGPVDQLIVHSPPDGERARALLPGKTVTVIPFPSFAGIAPQSWSREQARAALQVNGRVLLFFGFVRPYKGLSDLLEALPLVLAEGEATLLVVGEVWGSAGPYREKVRRLGLESRVRFVDRYVSDSEAALYFAAADLAVLPYREATGSAVLQLALGLGVPAVATRTGSMGDALRDGRTGYLVEPGDVPGLAQAIVRFFAPGRAEEMRREIARQDGRASWEPMLRAIDEASTRC